MSKGKRLHPVAIFFLFFSGLKEFTIPLLAAFFFGRGAATWNYPFTVLFVIGGLLLLFIYGYLKWLTFTYEVTSEELKIKQGIFIKKQRFIRRERIYSIDITAGPLQRLFQLVAVKVETAGGGNEPEVLLSAVTKQEATEIREQLLVVDRGIEESISEAKDQDEVSNQWKLPNVNLFLAALTSSGVGLAFLALMALVTQVEEWLPEQYLYESFGYLFQSGVAVLIVLFTILILFSWLISIIGTLLKYGNFTIVKSGEEIEITRGILEKRQLTLSLPRITAIRVVESILRQPFGLATVYVESAGGGSKDEQLSTVLFPLIKKKDLDDHLREIIPDYAFQRPTEPLPARSRIRYIIRKIVPSLFIAAFFAYFVPYGFIGSIIIVIGGFILGNLQFKDAGFGINETFLWISYRNVSKTSVVIPKNRIQAVEMKQSLIQKYRKLVTLQVSILTSIIGKSFRTIDISEEQESELLTWYSYEEQKG